MSQGENTNIEASEVELSTDDLMHLSAIDAPKAQSPIGAVPVAPVRATPKRTSTPPRGGSRTALYVMGATTIIACAAAALYFSQPDRSNSVVRQALRWTPLPNKDPEPIEEPTVTAESAKPVRIRNAFDKSEVFEFPPGTTQQEARDAVAQILLQRAVERQANTGSPQR